MNINKLNNQIQYWHSNKEIPDETKLILIEPKNTKSIKRDFNIKFDLNNIFFCGKIYNNFFDYAYYIEEDLKGDYPLLIYGLEEFKSILTYGYNHWNKVVNRWIYIDDLKIFNEQNNLWHKKEDIPKLNKLILFDTSLHKPILKSFDENLHCVGMLQITEYQMEKPIYTFTVFSLEQDTHLMYTFEYEYFTAVNKWCYLKDIKDLIS